MSSVVTAPGDVSPRPRRATFQAIGERHRPSRDFLAGVGGTVVLCLVAFLCSGGVDLAPNTWVQIGLIVLAAGTAVALALMGDRGRAWGAVTVLLFAALAALTYASIAWSVQPANSWLEANRTLSYLAAFATAVMLARLAPERWRALVGALAATAAIVCGYSLLVKIFPGTFDPGNALDRVQGRLRAPFDYWNAVGLMGALGLAPCLWAGARREGSVVLRGLAAPAIALLVPGLLLSYSRGSIVVAVIGLVIWFTLSPLRLRSSAILGLGAAGGTVISAWGLASHAISADGVPLTARITAGHRFGIVIVVALLLTACAGWAAVHAMARIVISARTRRTISTGLIGLVALMPVAGIVALAASSRGLTGEISHIWNGVTNPNGVVKGGDQPGRLVDLSNSRPHYWSQAITLGEHHLLAGVGADGFATAQPSSSSPVWNTQHAHAGHAHGYLAQTFADLGLIGLALSLALLVAWFLATRRSLDLRWPGRRVAARPPPDEAGAGERAGLMALLAVVTTFGFHSLIDWTWFIPGTAVPALACAGWLAGRGPLPGRVGRLSHARRLTRTPWLGGALVAVTVLTLVAVWGIVQPLRSADAYSAAFTAAAQGNGPLALSEARAAAAEDPVSVDPLFLLSRIYYYGLGNASAARQELVQAMTRQPSNPATWQELGCYDYTRHKPSAAPEFRRLLSLQPADTQVLSAPDAFCAGTG